MQEISNIPPPHGGRLINRFTSNRKNPDGMFSIDTSNDLRNEVENIAEGIFSPLEGFVGEDDFQSIIQSGHLKNGLAWTIPIFLDVDQSQALRMKDAVKVSLRNTNEHFGILHKIEEVYSFDKSRCVEILNLSNRGFQHPGVMKMIHTKDRLIGGN